MVTKSKPAPKTNESSCQSILSNTHHNNNQPEKVRKAATITKVTIGQFAHVIDTGGFQLGVKGDHVDLPITL
jgi:queuine/archaeosine tRNA-ribosyltransferase